MLLNNVMNFEFKGEPDVAMMHFRQHINEYEEESGQVLCKNMLFALVMKQIGTTSVLRRELMKALPELDTFEKFEKLS